MKKLLLLSCFSIGLMANAQLLQLKNGSYIPSTNINDLKNFNDWKSSEFENNIYGIIQFSRSTSLKEREEIEQETGIKFFDYMPKWAFLAVVPKNISINNLAKYSIKSIVPFEAKNKIATKLIERPLPNWIVKQNGNIEILVDVFPTVNHSKVVSLLNEKNILVLRWKNNHTVIVQLKETDLNTVATFPWVKFLQPTSAPTEYENLTERTNHRVNSIDAAYSGGLHYDGTGVAVSIGDDGVVGPHIDFRGRLTNNTIDMSSTIDHADHVTGIVGGGGNFDPITSGNGRGADLIIYDNYQNLANANADYVASGVRILSNSLGQGCNVGYNSDAQDMDALIRSEFSLLSVHSSGNSGDLSCGGNSQGFFTITGGYKAGKNAIATGNVLNDDALATSSSKGPSEDGRLKPEIVATGTDVYSTLPNNTYDSYTGTSMACPGVSGTLASLMQAYRANNAGADPYSALMKALLMNTADDLGNKGPDFKFGYGRINARRAFNAMNNQQYIIDSVDNGVVKTFTINVPANTSQMKVMCYWHDVEGTSASPKALVNDINIYLEDANAFTFNPLVLNNSNNNATLNLPAVEGVDDLNNSEQIIIDLPQTGGYNLNVEGFDIPQGPQKFVITYEFLTDSVTMIYPNGGESFVNGKTERIRWDAYGNNLGTFRLQYSDDAGASWNNIANNIPANQRYYDWTPPSTFNSGQMMMRIRRGFLRDASDTLFTILDVPKNLRVDTACGTTFHLAWDSLPGAEGYIVYQLGAKYMDSIGTSTTNGFYVTSGLNATDTFYFAVCATKASNGAKGLRTLAIVKLPGDINCLDDASSVYTTVPYNNIYSCNSLATQIPITMKIKNVGFRELYNIPVVYQVDANPTISEFLPGLLAIGDSAIYTFTSLANISTAGNHTIKTWVAMTNDLNRLDDTSMTTINILAPTVTTTPLTENFEGALFPPVGWRVIDGDTNVKWQKTLCFAGATNGNTHAAYMDFFNYNNLNQKDELETLQFDLTSVTTDSVVLTFDVSSAYRIDKEDSLSILVSNDCTETFNPTNYKKSGTNLATIGLMNTIFSPTLTTQWRKDQVDLSNYKGQKIFVRFSGINKKGNNVYIDNVNMVSKNAVPLFISNNTLAEAINVYPNPSNGIYNVEVKFASAKLITYSVLDYTGRKIKEIQQKITPNVVSKTTVDISDYAKGIYMLEINDGVDSQKIKLTKY